MKNVYYTYIYLDPRKPGNYKYDNLIFNYEPFYVGKGKNNRCYIGLKDNSKIKNTFKYNKINNIIKSGYFPIIEKIFENISNIDACKYEIDIIKKIGKLTDKTGPLLNITNGGDGMLGTKHTKEWIDLLSIPVIQYDLNMNFIKEYDSIKNAAIELNIEPIQISKVCAEKKYYKTAKGFIWKYKNKKQQEHIKTINNYKKKHTQDTLQKMSKPKNWKTSNGCHPSKNKIFKSKYPPILQYDLNMNLIFEWENINLLCKTLNYGVGNMMNTLNNNKNYAYKSYWKWKK